MNKKIVLKIVMSVILIGLLFQTINFENFLNAIRNSHKFYLIIGLCLTIPGILLSTYKWQILLSAKDIRQVGFFRLWMLYYIGMFFSNFLPTEIGGDVYRGYTVGKIAGRQPESFAAVLMERIIGLVAMIIYAIIGIFMNWSFASRLGLTQIGFICLGFLSIFFLLLFNNRFELLIRKKIGIGPIKKLMDKLTNFHVALTSYSKNLFVLIKSMIVSLIFQLISIAAIYIFFIVYINRSHDYTDFSCSDWNKWYWSSGGCDGLFVFPDWGIPFRSICGFVVI